MEGAFFIDQGTRIPIPCLVSRVPCPVSRFPIPDSRFPIPDSRFPIPIINSFLTYFSVF